MDAMVLREQLVGAECGVGTPVDSHRDRVDPRERRWNGAQSGQRVASTPKVMVLRAGSGTPDPAQPRFGSPFRGFLVGVPRSALPRDLEERRPHDEPRDQHQDQAQADDADERPVLFGRG